MRISNPITVKELRSRMRGIRAILPMIAYLAVLGIFVLIQFAEYGVRLDYSVLANKGRELGFYLLYAQIVLVLLLSPAYAASAITIEKERETFETMQTTLLTAWDIVSGKVYSGVSYAVLLVLSSLPLLSLSFWMGGFDFIHLTFGFLIIAATSLVVSVIGILLSTILTKSYLATGVTYGVIIGSVGLSYIFYGLLQLSVINSMTVQPSGGWSWHTVPYWFSFTMNPFQMLRTLDYGDTSFYYQGQSMALANPLIDGFSQTLQNWHIPYPALYIFMALLFSWFFLYLASYFLFRSSREGSK